MLVGICEVRFSLYDVGSLKEKRQVVKSLIERLKSRYNISIAELGDLDSWNMSTIGFAYVSNDSRRIESSVDKIINFIDGDHRLEIIDVDFEII